MSKPHRTKGRVPKLISDWIEPCRVQERLEKAGVKGWNLQQTLSPVSRRIVLHLWTLLTGHKTQLPRATSLKTPRNLERAGTAWELSDRFNRFRDTNQGNSTSVALLSGIKCFPAKRELKGDQILDFSDTFLLFCHCEIILMLQEFHRSYSSCPRSLKPAKAMQHSQDWKSTVMQEIFQKSFIFHQSVQFSTH